MSYREAHIVASVVEMVLISEVSTDDTTWMSQYFSADEQRAFSGRPARTVAGQLAVKRAIGRLISERFQDLSVRPRHIDITRDDRGAPRIAKISGPDEALNARLESRIRISISHSRHTAVGLATISGEGSGTR